MGTKTAPKNQYVRQIPSVKVCAGNNDRKVFKEDALQELAESIRQHGLAQPITLRPIGDEFEIVAGERRFRAMQLLGWDKVPAIVRELTDEEASAIMLVENTSRVDLDFIAEALAYQERISNFGWTDARVAEVAGVSLERVKSRLKLLKLAEDVQHLVKIGQMPLGHAVILEDLDVNRQRIAVRVFASAKHMPLGRWREIVGELLQQQADESQLSMFDLELQLMTAVEADTITPLRGKKAKTGAPTNNNLPKPRIMGATEKAGNMMERYILDLMQAGHMAEASAIGNLYNAMVAGNFISVPLASTLAKTAEDDQTVGDDAYQIME